MTRKSIERAILMLKVASEYINDRCPDELIFYDETKCDGYCVAEDCVVSADELEPLLTPWQPIETAPKYGVEVLLSLGGDELTIASWCEDGSCWREWNGAAWEPDGVTHWMPLPSPPKDTGQ